MSSVVLAQTNSRETVGRIVPVQEGQVLRDADARGILKPGDVSGWRDRQGVGSAEGLGAPWWVSEGTEIKRQSGGLLAKLSVVCALCEYERADVVLRKATD